MEATFLLLLFWRFSPRTISTSLSRVIWMSFSSTPGTSRVILYCLSVSGCRGRLQHARPIGWPLRHVQRRKTEAPECVIEQPVDFPMQLQDRADWPARRWQVIALHRQGRDGLLLLLLVLEPVRGANFLKSMSMSYLQKNWKTSYSSPLPAVTGSAPERHELLG